MYGNPNYSRNMNTILYLGCISKYKTNRYLLRARKIEIKDFYGDLNNTPAQHLFIKINITALKIGNYHSNMTILKSLPSIKIFAHSW